MKLVRRLCERLRVPNDCRDLGLIAAEYHTHCHRALELRASTLLKVLTQTDAFRRPERFEQFLVACEADSRGRTGFEERPYPQADYFRGALAAATLAGGVASAATLDDVKARGKLNCGVTTGVMMPSNCISSLRQVDHVQRQRVRADKALTLPILPLNFIMSLQELS